VEEVVPVRIAGEVDKKENKDFLFNDTFQQIIWNTENGLPNAVGIFIARIKSSIDNKLINEEL